MSEARIHIPDNIKNFLEIEHCDDFPINRYYLSEGQKIIFNEIIKMWKISKSGELQNMKIDYLNTTLLYGPTGTGKTTFARYIAYKMDFDFAYINFAKLIDGGVLGNTAKNLGLIFEYIANINCILLLDEIDCITQKRGTEGTATGGELSRITITLMQELDKLKKKKVQSIILAATNCKETMDPALISRFALQREIKQLKKAEEEMYIIKYLEDVKVPYNINEVKMYCNRHPVIKQRNIENDIIQSIVEWILNGKQHFQLKHMGENEEK